MLYIYEKSDAILCAMLLRARLSLAIAQRYLTGHFSQGSTGRLPTEISLVFRYINNFSKSLNFLSPLHIAILT